MITCRARCSRHQSLLRYNTGKQYKRLLLGLVLGAAIFAAARPNAQTFQTLYSFNGPPDGSIPTGVAIDRLGNLYGATRAGGHIARCRTNSAANLSDGIPLPGCGIVYQLGPAGIWAETVLHSFTSGADGAYPGNSLVLNKGALYGTTEYGGFANNTTCRDGCGTVFRFNLIPQRLRTLYTFTGGADSGGSYTAVVFDTNGNLYGTVEGGDGASPVDDLVFELMPPAPGSTAWTFNGLDPPGGGGDGEIRSSLVVDQAGNLYGTTRPGFPCDPDCGTFFGTVFVLPPPDYTEITLYTFTGGADGASPSGLTIHYQAGGNPVLFGTTRGGGADNAGTVFEFDPATQMLTTLYAFTGGADGANPSSPLIFRGGALYGEALNGGDPTMCPGNANFPPGCGTVFKFNLATQRLRTLYIFSGGADGAGPIGSMALDTSGALYGTTAAGGASTNCIWPAVFPSGCGTVYRITP
jgi:uncharacterized repeat protein (TIGR03803 family)